LSTSDYAESLSALEKRVNEIYKQYIEVICPYVIEIELLDNEFPVEILNEIRAIFTHLSKYYLSNEIATKEINLLKAEGHIKRSRLDCYKYICVAYDDNYKEFERRYKNTNLSFVDNGDFLPKLLESRKKAINLMKEARKSDSLINSENEIVNNEAFIKYEEAFIAYSVVYNQINSSFKKLENLRKKAVFKDVISVGGWIIGLIGIAVSIISIIL
jgi:hypothetical protein